MSTINIMIQISEKDREKVLESIKKGKIDATDISFPNLTGNIMLKIYREELMENL